MHACRLANWGPTHETPEGRPHLKPQVGENLEQRLAAPPTGPKPGTECRVIQSQGGPARPRDSSPEQLDRPPSTRPLARRAARSPSAGPAGCSFSKHKAPCKCPNPKAAESAASKRASQAQAAGSTCCTPQAQSRLRASQTQSGWIPLLHSQASQAKVAGDTTCVSQEQSCWIG